MATTEEIANGVVLGCFKTFLILLMVVMILFFLCSL